MSTNFDDNVGYLEFIRCADNKAVNIAKIIVQLKNDLANLQTVCIYFADNLKYYLLNS